MYKLQYKGNRIDSAVWTDSSEFTFHEIIRYDSEIPILTALLCLLCLSLSQRQMLYRNSYANTFKFGEDTKVTHHKAKMSPTYKKWGGGSKQGTEMPKPRDTGIFPNHHKWTKTLACHFWATKQPRHFLSVTFTDKGVKGGCSDP